MKIGKTGKSKNSLINPSSKVTFWKSFLSDFFYIYKGKFYQGYWACLHTQQKWSFPFPLIVKKCLNAWKVSDKIFVISNSIADYYTPMLEFLLWPLLKLSRKLCTTYWNGKGGGKWTGQFSKNRLSNKAKVKTVARHEILATLPQRVRTFLLPQQN